MDKIISLDYLVTNTFNKILPHNIFFDNFFSFFSLKGSFVFVWIMVIIIVVIFEERRNPGITKRDKRFIILFSISFLLAYLFSDIILKNIFIRPRPVLSNFICPKDFSFPSTHAATAFAAATVLAFFDKKRGWLYYIIAVLISYSRIYLGCHYFFDVLGGGFIGYFLSRFILIRIKKYES